MSETSTSQPDRRGNWRDWFTKDNLLRVRTLVFLLPLIGYAVLIRTKITFGDGSELLTAMYTLGGPHPSGYPLFTLLGWLPSHLPVITPHWNVAFLLSAVPSAVATLAIYLTLRQLDVSKPLSALGGLVWAANWHVVYQATRIEVYSLHCMFIALTFWAFSHFARPRKAADEDEDDQGPPLKWIYLAVLFTCLGLTNHLTTVFLVPALVVGMLIVAPKKILRPRTILIMAGIALACAAIYLYLPLQAMANDGDRISWNDPQTLERFWFHVTGEEYAVFRKYDRFWDTLKKFYSSLQSTYFPGVLVVCIVGVYEWAVRRWRLLLVVLLFELASVAYVSTYHINDLATYYTGLYIPVTLALFVGFDWLFKMRFGHSGSAVETRRRGHTMLGWVAIAVIAGWVGGLYWNSRASQYREALAADMSRQTLAAMEDPALIFTSVDGHTFPMWYQTFVASPDREVVVLDTVMFHLANKQWYRDWLRETYPWVEWPSDKVAMGGHWRQWIIDNNPDINMYAILHAQWPERESYGVNKGWHAELHDGRPPSPEARTNKTRHVYMARHRRLRSGDYFFDSQEAYEAGEERIACVTDWWDHPDFNATWKFIGPGGKEVEFGSHHVPDNATQSWEYLQPEEQIPGKWVCEVEVPGEPTLRVAFEIVADD